MTGEHTNIRARAADYAKIFLAQKYKEEYQELYRAYLTNRGIKVRNHASVIDERLLIKE
jgi:hypothetical protein